MKQNIHAIATALTFFVGGKDEGARNKDFGFFGCLRERVLLVNPTSRSMSLMNSSFGFSSASELCGNYRPCLSTDFESKGRSGEFCFLLRTKGSCHGLAMKAGKVEGEGQKESVKYLYNGMFHFVQHDGMVRIMGYWRQWWLTRRLPQPAAHNASVSGFARLPDGQAMTKRGRGSAINRLRPSLLTLLLTVVVSPLMAQQQQLKIGDTLPQIPKIEGEVLHHKPFLVLFIRSNCRSLRQVLQHTDSLASKAGIPVLAITKEQPEAMHPMFREVNKGQSAIRWIMADSFYHSLFPHRISPHLVWINAAAQIAAITHAEGLELADLQAFRKGNTPAMATKQDLLDFDAREKLVQQQYPGKMYYSMVQGYMEGAPSTSLIERDSTEGTVRTLMLNQPLYRMYLMAFGRASYYLPNRLVWEVKDQANYLPGQSALSRQEWLAKHSYSYESVWPIALPDSLRLQKIRDDLNLASRMNTRLEYRRVKAWVLEKTGTIQPAKPQKVFNNLGSNAEIKELRNATLTSFTSYYNFKPDHIPVVDETGYTGKIDMQLKVADMEDLETLNRALAPYHLRITPRERTLEFIIFHENQTTR